MYSFGSRVIVDGADIIVRKLRMEWHSRCLVMNVEAWLHESKRQICMTNVLQTANIWIYRLGIASRHHSKPTFRTIEAVVTHDLIAAFEASINSRHGLLARPTGTPPSNECRQPLTPHLCANRLLFPSSGLFGELSEGPYMHR